MQHTLPPIQAIQPTNQQKSKEKWLTPTTRNQQQTLAFSFFFSALNKINVIIYHRSENQSSVGEITLQGKITSLDLSPGNVRIICTFGTLYYFANFVPNLRWKLEKLLGNYVTVYYWVTVTTVGKKPTASENDHFLYNLAGYSAGLFVWYLSLRDNQFKIILLLQQ